MGIELNVRFWPLANIQLLRKLMRIYDYFNLESD